MLNAYLLKGNICSREKKIKISSEGVTNTGCCQHWLHLLRTRVSPGWGAGSGDVTQHCVKCQDAHPCPKGQNLRFRTQLLHSGHAKNSWLLFLSHASTHWLLSALLKMHPPFCPQDNSVIVQRSPLFSRLPWPSRCPLDSEIAILSHFSFCSCLYPMLPFCNITVCFPSVFPTYQQALCRKSHVSFTYVSTIPSIEADAYWVLINTHGLQYKLGVQLVVLFSSVPKT